MTYRIRVIDTREYLTLDIPGYKENQEYAREMSNKLKKDVAIINEEDDAILCIAQYDFRHGGSYLSLCTTGNHDDPTK